METVIEIIAQVVLVLSSLFLILTILMHKGSGGGLSDMFGGGLTSSAGSSVVAMRNLNRITVVTAIVWFISVVVLGLLPRFFS
ncbi:preprotein translocase subunit SecG [Varibaculum cambriense]|uniref:preprotein translocase subunit SecG n=1 Tax=Varibaculum cambriense TaxID=184870 RepID=UPI0028FEAEBD|nr:preprotein translocase subunit SecG [Varibaculum cambriense]MDU1684476.1 preprotein translocase subunit SecG [Varibaculum cambriense]